MDPNQNRPHSFNSCSDDGNDNASSLQRRKSDSSISATVKACARSRWSMAKDFRRCYRAVGDFPEVKIGPKWLATRILTAFGAGLAPIL